MSRQSLKRSQSLLKASEARLEGRPGQQARRLPSRASGRADRGCAGALRGRAPIGAGAVARPPRPSPGDPVEPPAVSLMETVTAEPEPLEALVPGPSSTASSSRRPGTRSRTRAAASSLAKQNLLPQLDANLGFSRLGGGPAFSRRLEPRRHPHHVRLHHLLSRSSARRTRPTGRSPSSTSPSRERALHQRELDVEAEVRSAVRELERIRKSVAAAEAGGRGGGPAAAARHPALPARPGLQLRRGGRRGQPGARAQRPRGPSRELQGRPGRAGRVTRQLDRQPWTWPRSFALRSRRHERVLAVVPRRAELAEPARGLASDEAPVARAGRGGSPLAAARRLDPREPAAAWPGEARRQPAPGRRRVRWPRPLALVLLVLAFSGRRSRRRASPPPGSRKGPSRSRSSRPAPSRPCAP